MKSSTKDKAKGKLNQVVGVAKEATGRAIGNQKLADNGTAQKVGGKLREKVGDVKKVFEL